MKGTITKYRKRDDRISWGYYYKIGEMTAYVGDLMIDFVHVDHLYRIRNARGKRLEEVGEMLVESDPLLDARSFERERQVRKHICDYTLFLTGMFPNTWTRCGAGACDGIA
jgi:hypothetical protein